MNPAHESRRKCFLVYAYDPKCLDVYVVFQGVGLIWPCRNKRSEQNHAALEIRRWHIDWGLLVAGPSRRPRCRAKRSLPPGDRRPPADPAGRGRQVTLSAQQALSSSKLIEQRLGLFQIERIEPLSEPAVDRSEQIAGLRLVTAVNELKIGASLQCRVGVATGLVVVGNLIGAGESQERGIVGDTPNLAARLQGIAEPNTVVIAESTRRVRYARPEGGQSLRGRLPTGWRSSVSGNSLSGN
jgi:hypothetical protein